MAFFLFQKYDSSLSTAKFRLIQASFDIIGIIISFVAFLLVYNLVVYIFWFEKKITELKSDY